MAAWLAFRGASSCSTHLCSVIAHRKQSTGTLYMFAAVPLCQLVSSVGQEELLYRVSIRN